MATFDRPPTTTSPTANPQPERPHLSIHPLVARSHIRDSILIDDALIKTLTHELPEGQTILIAARVVRHKPDYSIRLDNYNLIIAADEYDARGGSIDLSGRDGAQGSKGSTGTPGSVSATSNKPGGRGGNGGDGHVGGKGNKLDIFCRKLVSGRFIARGGSGGAGGTGGTGGAGDSHKSIINKVPLWEYADGGGGGNGGKGGVGGQGGKVTVTYLQSTQPPVVDVGGGKKGSAGAAGAGGKRGGPPAAEGAPGSVGTPGSAAGAAGTAVVRAVAEEQFWSALRAEIGTQSSSTWASFRVHCGDYEHRRAAGPNLQVCMTRATDNYRAAANLEPASQGQARLDAVLAGLNPLGLRNDIYIIPDFLLYESAYTAYTPQIQLMLGNAVSLLLQLQDDKLDKQQLEADHQHFQGQKAVVESELTEANLELKNAESAVDEVDARIAAVEAELEAKKKELEKASADLNGDILGSVLSVIGAVAAVAGACVTGGASLAALPGILVASEDAWSRISKAANGELQYDGRPFADLIQWNDEKGNFKPQLKDGIKQQAAGLQAVVTNGMKIGNSALDLIDKVKVFDELGEVKIDGSLTGEYNELLKRSAQLHLDRAQAQMGVEIAKIRVQTVMLKGKQVDADIAATKQIIDTAKADTAALARMCRMLIRRSQEYVDVLLRFRFFAVRALEIYTNQSHSDLINHALGWIGPNDEADAWARLEGGDSTKVAALLESYLATWGKLPDLITLKNSYLSYANSPKLRTIIGEKHDFGSDAVAVFKATGSVEFELSHAALAGDAREPKIIGVSVALVGATADRPTISCVLVHGGTATVLLSSGVEITQQFPPGGSPIQAVTTAEAMDAIAPSPVEPYWGRSPATRWRLYIEPEFAAKVNLAGLSQIKICLYYKAFRPDLPG
jgi:hypothetical protein